MPSHTHYGDGKPLTEREAAEREGFPLVVCRLCGDEDGAHYMNGTGERMVAESLCFTCNFWTDGHLVSPGAIVVEHTDGTRHHYTLVDESGPKSMRGFGGHRFVVRYLNGKEVVTTNLWTQGEIPERFYDRFPISATLR